MGLRGGGAPALLGLAPACNLRPPTPRLPPPAVLLELGSGGGGGSFRLPAGPHKKASEGSAAKPRPASRVSLWGRGARGILQIAGCSQRPCSTAYSIYSKYSSNQIYPLPGPPSLSLSVLIQLSSACHDVQLRRLRNEGRRPSPWNRRRRPGRSRDHFFYFCFLVFFHLLRKKLYI